MYTLIVSKGVVLHASIMPYYIFSPIKFVQQVTHKSYYVIYLILYLYYYKINSLSVH